MDENPPEIERNVTARRCVENQLKICNALYERYEWLVDAYVLNFYTENSWNKMPLSWQTDLTSLNPKQLSKILNYDKPLAGSTLPLSLLALRILVRHYDVPRKQKPVKQAKFSDKLEKLLWKHVKPKKRHEISTLAQITSESAKKNHCSYVVDIGSGVGHLCRTLAYGYGLKMCGIEAQKPLGVTAKLLDEQFESFIKKYPESGVDTNGCAPTHVNMRIETDLSPEDFVGRVRNALEIENKVDFRFGIIALHACGDLTATLLRLYKECPNIAFLNIVGCCYMKLTTSNESKRPGYPLSCFATLNQHSLSYNSREVACHAIENYIDRLDKGHYWQLKIHAYRACLEKILKAHHPDLCESGLANVKYTEALSFHDYCSKALRKLGLSIARDVAEAPAMREDLKNWNRVVIFYSLRLLVAPVIESIVLLDRYLYMLENFGDCALVPAFDPKLSPRNHILTSSK